MPEPKQIEPTTDERIAEWYERCDAYQESNLLILPSDVREVVNLVVAERDRADAAERERDTYRALQGQANYLLARIVAAANVSAIDGDGGFVTGYDMPTGPIHKAIPFLAEQGIVVTNDGRIRNGSEQAARDGGVL